MPVSEDYRNTKYCPELENVVSKKETLELKIMSEHPRLRIVYNKVKEKNGNYFDEFSKIYNHKCAYCGIHLRINGRQHFEIDHYICESFFAEDTTGRAQAGKMSNLIFACYICNRGKSDLLIQGEYRTKLNPDDSSLSEIFYRDENYNIRINERYADDSFISTFYKNLKLGYLIRRLDYLLLEMRGMLDDDQYSDAFMLKLYKLRDELSDKRNTMRCS